MQSVRWNVTVSPDTDQSLRMFLAAQGDGHKGELSQFVEDAVKDRILELTVAEIKTANARVSEVEIDAAVDEAVQWARQA